MPVMNYTILDGEVVSEDSSLVASDFIPDPLGSTVALVDGNQAITDQYDYWPYGEIRSHSGPSSTPFTYVGTLGYRSEGMASSYVRARTLRRDLACWTTVDPMSMLLGVGDPYLYANSNPTSWVDPSGLWCIHLFGSFCLGTTCFGNPSCGPAPRPAPRPTPPRRPATPPRKPPTPGPRPFPDIKVRPPYQSPSTPPTLPSNHSCTPYLCGVFKPGWPEKNWPAIIDRWCDSCAAGCSEWCEATMPPDGSAVSCMYGCELRREMCQTTRNYSF